MVCVSRESSEVSESVVLRWSSAWLTSWNDAATNHRAVPMAARNVIVAIGKATEKNFSLMCCPLSRKTPDCSLFGPVHSRGVQTRASGEIGRAPQRPAITADDDQRGHREHEQHDQPAARDPDRHR